jgi:hypothetical protein
MLGCDKAISSDPLRLAVNRHSGRDSLSAGGWNGTAGRLMQQGQGRGDCRWDGRVVALRHMYCVGRGLVEGFFGRVRVWVGGGALVLLGSGPRDKRHYRYRY